MAGRKSQSAGVSSSDGVSNELVAQLFKEIENLKRQLNEKQPVETQEAFNQNKINQDDYIKVMSLCPYLLNLSTDRNGQGRIYAFYRFGETKRIIYADLVKIVEANRHFLERGYFYILDSRCIKNFGVEDVYENILSKDGIETILEGKSNDVVSLFKSCGASQQELIIDMLIQKMVSDSDSVDLNLIDKISRASGVKIQEKAEAARDLDNSLRGEDQEQNQ